MGMQSGDERMKRGHCHPVSFTMHGWEGISLTYITPSPPSPLLTSPPLPPFCKITRLVLAYLLFQYFLLSTQDKNLRDGRWKEKMVIQSREMIRGQGGCREVGWSKEKESKQ